MRAFSISHKVIPLDIIKISIRSSLQNPIFIEYQALYKYICFLYNFSTKWIIKSRII
jgi:hypothetical protein